MKKFTSKLSIVFFLFLMAIMILPMQVKADDGQFLYPIGTHAGTSDDPYRISFGGKAYATYPGAMHRIVVPSDVKFYEFEADFDGILGIQYAGESKKFPYMAKNGSYYGPTKLIGVQEGNSYKFQLPSECAGKTVELYAHAHFSDHMDNQANVLYSTNDANTCEKTLRCWCKSASEVLSANITSTLKADEITHPAHVYDAGKAKVVAPTCTAKGYTTNTCIHCGYVKKYNEKAIVPHTYSAANAKVVKPTCTSGGYTTNKCTKCTYVKKYDEKAALGHSYAGTCTKVNSLYHKRKCVHTGCAEYQTEYHGAWKTSGKTHTCGYCGYSFSDTSSGTNTNGSNYVQMDANSAPYGFVNYYVTKFSNNEVHITVRVSSNDAYHKSTVLTLYANNKKVKKIGRAGNKNSSYFITTVKGKNIAKKSFRVEMTNASKKVLKTPSKKPAANKFKNLKFSYSRKASNYRTMANVWRPSKLVKKGNKYVVSGFFVSNHIIKLANIKYNVYLYYMSPEGKITNLGKKTISSGTIQPKSAKNKGVTFTCKKNLDFKNGGYIYLNYGLKNWKYPGSSKLYYN